MSDRFRNRPDSQSAPDDWLTPPKLIESLGKFDLDPACPGKMPWHTAKVMVSNAERVGRGVTKGDGLLIPWRGRVWCNPPYSRPLPWVELMSEHRRGTMLLPAKSFDTRWGQLMLTTADLVLFVAGRYNFHLPSGKPGAGGWSPSVLAAYGAADVRALLAALKAEKVVGIPMIRRFK